MHMLRDPSNGAFSASFFMDSVSDRVDEGKRKHGEKRIAGLEKRRDDAIAAQKRHASVANVADTARQLVGDVHKILRTTACGPSTMDTILFSIILANNLRKAENTIYRRFHRYIQHYTDSPQLILEPWIIKLISD